MHHKIFHKFHSKFNHIKWKLFQQNQYRTLNTLTQWSAPQDASSELLDSSESSWFLQAIRFTVETWHNKGSNFTAITASNPSLAIPPESLHSSRRPLSIPTARIPVLRDRSSPAQDSAVILSLKVGNVASCLIVEVPSIVHNLTVLSREPVANWWAKGFHEHAHIILLCASCFAINW